MREIERTYGDEVGAARFEEACLTLQELVRQGPAAMATSPREQRAAEQA